MCKHVCVNCFLEARHTCMYSEITDTLGQSIIERLPSLKMYCHYNIRLIGVSAKWSYVTASPSHHDQAIPILSPLHVDHPYIPLFKSQRIFDLLVICTYVGWCIGKCPLLEDPQQ